MVRIARLSWTDDGPIPAPRDDRDWLGEDEPDDVERPSKQMRSPRRKRCRASPIDRRPAANSPSDIDGDARESC
jgi:hypothetical protein